MSTQPLARVVGGLAGRVGVRDLLELTKPRLTLMVLLTTAVGFLIASDGPPDLMLLLNTAAGTALSAAGASALNQLIERRPDALMVRTVKRPLPNGRMLPGDALAFGVACGASGVAYLAFAVNLITAALSLATIVLYVAVYTPLKSRSPSCTLVGAIPGAIPIVMGCTAARGRIDVEAAVLFGILFFWQLPHFMAIAALYLDDYRRAGFPMMPVVDWRRRDGSPEGDILLPPRSATGRQAVGWCLALIVVSLAPLALATGGSMYAAGALALGVAYLSASAGLALERTRVAARRLFRVSLVYLPALLLWMAIHKAAA